MTATRTRYLSATQASACENADPESPCNCRCGGILHGVNRLRTLEGQNLRAETWELPEADPHFSRPPTCNALERVADERERARARSFGR